MTSLIQLLLVIVICVLTLLLTFAAIQVFHLLHDYRQAIKRKKTDARVKTFVPKPRRFFRRTPTRLPLHPTRSI